MKPLFRTIIGTSSANENPPSAPSKVDILRFHHPENSLFMPRCNIPPRVFFLLMMLVSASSAHAQMHVDGYTHQEIAGWDVYVSADANANASTATSQALTLLESKLTEILTFSFSTEVRDALLAVPIFVDRNVTSGAAVYHPSANWLQQNGYPVEKAQAVEISNVRNFVDWTNQNQPMMVLHELAHALHDRLLSFNNVQILDAYTEAMTRNLYVNVLYNPGIGAPFIASIAYASTNFIEYFAEISEAYFGENDYFPFVRSDLESYDALGFEAVEELWQVSNATAIESTPDIAMPAPYPNPATGMVTVSGKVAVYDVMGRQVSEGTDRLDLSNLSAGLYFVKGETTIWPILKQ